MDKNVHTEHCCAKHGCKYSDQDCPVFTGKQKQSYACEFCDDHEEGLEDRLTAAEAELYYLRWFYGNADFGPAHGDVMLWLQEKFTKETGKQVPEDYRYE